MPQATDPRRRFTVGASLAGAVCAVLLLPTVSRATAMATRTAALTSAVQVIVHTRQGGVRRCSGYMFSTQGLVATDYHAIRDAVRIQVFQADLGVLDVSRIRRVDPKTNIAILGVAQALDPELTLAYPADLHDYVPGELVHVLDHAQYRDALQTDTTVAAAGFPHQFTGSAFAAQYTQDAPLVSVVGPFDAGSAGGIVLDESWNVVGMLVGSDPASNGQRTVFALQAGYLMQLARGTFDVDWASLRTDSAAEAAAIDSDFGPPAKPREFKAPMDGGFIAWFSPIYPSGYADPEFTSEINDKIQKNWFYTGDLIIDRRPLREWSASRLVIWGASTNPWNLEDGSERYMHFDADSIFNKRVYKTQTTEERIMARYIVAMQLSPGRHTIQYTNKAANYKAFGIKRRDLDIDQAEVQLLDIQGLSLVQMDELPAPAPGIGEAAPVKYTLTRRPLSTQEIGYGIRSNWFELKP